MANITARRGGKRKGRGGEGEEMEEENENEEKEAVTNIKSNNFLLSGRE